MNDTTTTSESTGTTQSATRIPPRGPRLRMLVLMVLLLLGGVGFGAALHEPLQRSFNSARNALGADEEPDAPAGDVQYYTCGMHPWVIEPEPGLCPICHMELTPMDPAKLTGELTIDPVVVQNMGVRITTVEQGPLRKTVRTVGNVTYDQTAVRTVNTKVAGWIETLHVDREGQRVERGDPLLEVYAPELFAAQQEYLIAWRNRDAAGMDDSMLEAARTRLRYFDMSDEQIAELEQRGTPQKTVTIHSPHTGVVTAKHVNEGTRIGPEMPLFEIADLSTVWVMVSIYESQLPYVEQGQPARMRLTYLPRRTFEGEVVELYPYMEQDKRQARARLRFENPDSALKPGMYATVELHKTLDEQAVLVPNEAVIGTGEREIVLVSLGEGRFEPRDVTIGVESDEQRVQILDGLEPGEKVVISGQFLLDSESRTREALAKMVEGEPAAAQAAEVESESSASFQPLSEAGEAHLATLLEQYLAVGDALHEDTTDGVAPAADRMLNAIGAMTDDDPPDAPHFWREHHEMVQTLRAEVRMMRESDDLQTVRVAYGKSSAALDTLLKRTGVPRMFSKPIDRMVCGMVTEAPEGGLWLQSADREPRNPYMGASMPQCHQADSRQRLPVAESIDAPAAPPGQPATSAPPHSH